MIDDRPAIKVVMKQWGFEKIVINNSLYCGKLLYILKGQQTSLHYHKTKDETFFVHSGKVKVYYYDNVSAFTKLLATNGISANMSQSLINVVVLKPGDNFRIVPGIIHQVYATEDSQIYEFSTQHIESDIVRL